jgi:hypothetical protein
MNSEGINGLGLPPLPSSVDRSPRKIQRFTLDAEAA